MSDLPRAHTVLKGSASPAEDHVALDYEGRFLRRKRLVSRGGRAFVADLAEVTSLDDGDVLELTDGTRIAVQAAPEALLAVRGEGLARLAWHIGNRHTPCRVEADRLLIRDDHVLADMLRRLGAEVEPLQAPFQPEGGAYGHGRTLGHSHGPEDHVHAHGHDHDHSLRHDHGHDHNPNHSQTPQPIHGPNPAHGDAPSHADAPRAGHGHRPNAAPGGPAADTSL